MYQQACQRLIEPRTIKPSVYCPSAQSAAHQRIRAASNLLETLYCLCFKEADTSDIPNIVSALYLLTQDGNDLLDIARQRLPKLTG